MVNNPSALSRDCVYETSDGDAARILASTGNGTAASPIIPKTSPTSSNANGNTVTVTAVPVVTASAAYTVGNEVGQVLTFSNIFGSLGSGIVQSAVLRMKSVQTSEFDLYLFNANPSHSSFADKTAPAINSADIPALIGKLSFTSAVSALGTHTIYNLDGLGKAIALGAGNTTLFGILVTTGTPTFTATSDILGVDLIPLQD